jgi:threonine dehydratase
MTSSDGVVAGSGVDHIPIGLQEIEAAYRLLTGKAEFLPGRTTQFALRTPLVLSEPLTQQLGCRVWLKLENLQRTGSYKVRGAFNNVAQLPPEQRAKGLVTASAGNHAQGVAAAAAVFDIAAQTSVFVPVGTPKVKQENTRAFGVDVREVGDTFDQARQAAYQEAERSGRAFIEPFDAWNTIAGQGTVGLEIAADLPTCRGIVAPIGGGGLISGIALAARELLPGTEVIGAQATGAAAMIASLESGAPTDLAFPPTTQIADGIKVSRPGDRPFVVVQSLIGADRIVAVPDFETVAAAADLMVYAKVIAEGAGAISLAALREIQMGRFAQHAPFAADDDVVVIVSGGNIDPSFSWRILYEQTVPNLMTVRVAMPDRPGELLRMLLPIAKLNVNIIDVDVNRLDSRPRIGERIVELCVAVAHQAQADSLIAALSDAGYRVLVSRWQDPAVDSRGNTTPSAYLEARSAPQATQDSPPQSIQEQVSAQGVDLPDPTEHDFEDPQQGPVLVVNKKYPLPRDYTPADLRDPAVFTRVIGPLREPAAVALETMMRKAEEDGISLCLVSGFRSWERQRTLYEEAVGIRGIERVERFIARPGHSEHQAGLAVDLGVRDRPELDTVAAFAESAESAWLNRHAHEFGYHLRYASAREAVTGFSGEPWHYRFVGRRLAQILKTRDLTLEEYLGVEGGDYRPDPVQE